MNLFIYRFLLPLLALCTFGFLFTAGILYYTRRRQKTENILEQTNKSLSNILVEGSDLSRFKLSNVPSNLVVSDLAEKVLEQYDDPDIFRDSKGNWRPMIVEKESTSGSTERLSPELTLRDAGILPEDVISLSPEVTAGCFSGDTLVRAMQVNCHSNAVLTNQKFFPPHYIYYDKEGNKLTESEFARG